MLLTAAIAWVVTRPYEESLTGVMDDVLPALMLFGLMGMFFIVLLIGLILIARRAPDPLDQYRKDAGEHV